MHNSTGIYKSDHNILNTLAVYLLFLGYLIDLSGKMGLRFFFVYPSLFFLIVKSFSNNINSRHFFFVIFLLLGYPFLLTVFSFFFYDNYDLITSQFMSTFQMIFIFLAIKDFNPKKLLDILLYSILYVQMFSFFVFVGCFLNIPLFINLIDLMGRPFDGGYFGFLRVGDFALPQLYFKSTLIFVFPAIYFFSLKKYWKSFLSITTLFLALSKSGSILALCGILYFIINRRKSSDLIFIIIAIILLIYFGESYLDNYINLNESYTADVRRGQYNWFIKYIIENPIKFLFGSGFGNSVYINNEEVVALELDHIDTIRKYGVLWLLILFSPIFLKIFQNFKDIEHKGLGISYLLTFIAVGTNPLLLTSVFFILSYIVFRSFTMIDLND